MNWEDAVDLAEMAGYQLERRSAGVEAMWTVLLHHRKDLYISDAVSLDDTPAKAVYLIEHVNERRLA